LACYFSTSADAPTVNGHVNCHICPHAWWFRRATREAPRCRCIGFKNNLLSSAAALRRRAIACGGSHPALSAPEIRHTNCMTCGPGPPCHKLGCLGPRCPSNGISCGVSGARERVSLEKDSPRVHQLPFRVLSQSAAPLCLRAPCWGLVLKCYELRTRQHKMLNIKALRPSKHYFPLDIMNLRTKVTSIMLRRFHLRN
jgi:hypothetical protein